MFEFHIILSDILVDAKHYLNQCGNIVNWSPRNKLQWIYNRWYIFIQSNAFENVSKMVALLFCSGFNVLNNLP